MFECFEYGTTPQPARQVMSNFFMLIIAITVSINSLQSVPLAEEFPKAQLREILEERESKIAEHHYPEDTEHHGEYEHARPSDRVIGWDWHNMWLYIAIPGVLLLAALSKILYYALGLYKRIPESVMLILLGILIGGIFHYAKHSTGSHKEPDLSRVEWSDVQEDQEVPSEAVVFTADRFFFILLPPIILESAYQLHDRAFFSNLGPIFFYAFIGTFVNIVLVGVFLWLMAGQLRAYTYDNDINPLECALFATIISAVDPVAVLSVFQELKINHPLYFIVFGESLFNDAVVITVYHVLHSVIIQGIKNPDNVNTASAIAYGFGKIILSFFGGVVVGFIFGLLSVVSTRWSNSKVRVTDPLIVILMAYLAYIAAELVWFSGIVSLVTCGIMQEAYVRYNLSEKSNTTINFVVKIMAVIAEIIIFFFLGRACIIQKHVWDSGFVTFAFVFVIVCRFISVFCLTSFVNLVFKRRNPIDYDEQLIMAIGGLRGAIAFALVYMIDKSISNKKMFVTTTLFIILFTVIVLGTITKPLVAVLRVRRQERKDLRSIAFINRKVVETFLPVIEDLAGHGKTNCCVTKLENLNNHCLQRLLIKGGSKTVRDKDNELNLETTPKHDIHAPTIGPFRDVTQDFNETDYKNNDSAFEQLGGSTLAPMDAGKTTRERVQVSKHISKAFQESKIKKKSRTASLNLGRRSKAPVYQQTKSESQNDKENIGKVPDVGNELKTAMNNNDYYRNQSSDKT